MKKGILVEGVLNGAAGEIRFGRVLHLGSWIGFYKGSFPNTKAIASAPTLNFSLRLARWVMDLMLNVGKSASAQLFLSSRLPFIHAKQGVYATAECMQRCISTNLRTRPDLGVGFALSMSTRDLKPFEERHNASRKSSVTGSEKTEREIQ
ncbi:hypothetical protein [Saccharibacillus endophyticus]|uniref:hypothetical protein n=1 Tax=Saccharibacillus endophyticus TaxID=2060666 RepID=UPI0015577276|nr:hypothetical protein [Saccharibacillus endophyticus]